MADEKQDEIDWQNCVIDRINYFRGRTVGSLTESELRSLAPWLERAEKHWKTLDGETKALYDAIMARMADEINREPLALPISAPSPVPVREMHQESLMSTDQPEPPTATKPLMRAPVHPPQSTQQSSAPLPPAPVRRPVPTEPPSDVEQVATDRPTIRSQIESAAHTAWRPPQRRELR